MVPSALSTRGARPARAQAPRCSCFIAAGLLHHLRQHSENATSSVRLPDPNGSFRGAGRALIWCPDASQPWGTGAVGAGVGPRREQQAFFLLVDHLLTP